MSCTQEKLSKFSLDHYTFINQFFGDVIVREIIAEVYNNPKYEFEVVVDLDFGDGGSDHHILRKNNGGGEVCSGKYQEKHDNDTLCQSYSLLTYHGIKIDRDHTQRQLDMIEMYRGMLDNDEFIDILTSEIDIPNKRWRDYRSNSNGGKRFTKRMTPKQFFKLVDRTLDRWEEYGHHYFTGDGSCPTSSIQP